MRRIALALAVAGCALMPAMAQDKQVNLKVSLWVPTAHPLYPSTKAWVESMEKDSNGTIKATLFPAEQLGKAFDHYDMARDGIADVTYINPGYQPGRFPVIAVGQIPFTFSDAGKGTAALDTWYRKYAPAEMKDTKFCFAFMHDPGSLHSRKKVTVPGDIKGMKIRPAHSTTAELVTMLGGTNVQASAPEARDMLERGVADAIFFPWGSMFLFGVEKHIKYSIDAPLYTTMFTYNINRRTYDNMSAAQKKVIDDHCTTAWAVKFAEAWGKFEHDGIAKMKALPDHEVYKLTDAQMAEWRKTVEPLTQKWSEAVRKVGVDPDAAMKELKDSIARNNAGL